MNLRTIRITALLSCLMAGVLLTTGYAFAQGAQGTILGHVADPSGASVANANVTVRNQGTQVANIFTTTVSGDYVVPNLNPGLYKVTVEAAGFKAATSAVVQLQVEQTLRQNFALTVGAGNETVSVSSDAQMLQTDNETQGQVISGELIEKLPLNGRDFTNLLQIGVGTTTTPGGVQNAGFSLHGVNPSFQQVSINGAHSDSISYNIDGIYDSDFFFSEPTNIPGELALQEFKTMNGQYGAQYGQGSAQVNVAIKTGTNAFHGALYEFLQNDYFNPDNAKNLAVNELQGGNLPLRAEFKQNQFGGTFGGPVSIPFLYHGKDKTFFFVSYDGARLHQGAGATGLVVPTADELSGNFSDWPYPIYDPLTTIPNPAYNSTLPTSGTNSPVIRQAFANNQIPAGRIDPTAKNFLPYFQAATNSSCTNLTTGCKNFEGTTVNTTQSDIETVRFDQNFRNADHVFFTGNLGNNVHVAPSLKFGQGNQLYVRSRLFGLTWTHPVSSRTLNEATIGYSREHFLSGPTSAYGPNVSEQVGLSNTLVDPSTFDLPTTCFSVYDCIGGGSPTTFFDNIYQGVDTLTLIRGKHTLSLGIDFRRINVKEFDNYNGTGNIHFNGQYTASNPVLAGTGFTGASAANGPFEGNAFADFLLGQTNSASGPPPVGTDLQQLWGNNWNLYVQDDIRASDRLTINAGLRWERPGDFSSSNGSGYAFNPQNGGSFVWASKAFVTPVLAAGGNPNWLGCCSSKQLVKTDNKDFAPRIGFAYRPEVLHEKGVVRGGYGIFYDTYTRYYDFSQFDDNSLYTKFAAPYQATTGQETQSTAQLKNLWSNPLTINQGFTVPVYNFLVGGNGNQVNWPYNHNPYNQQWSLDVQYELRPKLLLDTAYVGAHGIHESTQIYVNAGFAPKVAGDPCNSLQDVSQATGSNASCATDPNFQPIDTRVPYPNLPNSTYANANFFGSSYNSLQVQLIQRAVHGLQYNVNYTYSKSMDISSGVNNIYGESGIVQNPHNPSQQYGLAASDQTHRATATYSYEVPTTIGHMFGINGLDRLFTGWSTSGIYTLASGFPFDISGGVSTDQMGPNAGVYLANYTGLKTPGFKRTLTHYFDTAKYSTPALGTYGTTNKSPERTPYYTNFDMSVGKTTKITEGQSFLVRAEFFNVASTWHNNTYLLQPDAAVTDSNFGSLLSNDPGIGNANLTNPRVIQLGAQYTF